MGRNTIIGMMESNSHEEYLSYKEMILKNGSWDIPSGTYHLHSRYLKGDMMWVISTRRSRICKEEGRCKIIKLEVLS